VPAQDSARSHDEPHPGQALDGQCPGQHRQPRPVRPRQAHMHPRLLPLRNSELMPQDQDLRVLPPRFPARQPEQRHRTRDDQEDQLHARKPKITARPGRPPPASKTPDTVPGRQRTLGSSAQVAEFPARTGCRCLSATGLLTASASGPRINNGFPGECRREVCPAGAGEGVSGQARARVMTLVRGMALPGRCGPEDRSSGSRRSGYPRGVRRPGAGGRLIRP
jgi:hypothetical protein